MIRLVIHVLLLAIVVVFVALNVGYTTSINLFGYMFTDISTVAVTLIAFIVGIIYSFFYYVLNYFYKSGKKKARERSKQSKDKEKELKEKESELKDTAKRSKELPSPAATTQADVASPEASSTSKGKSKKGFFSRGK
jgi:phosphotransferase system  glucose/maltose/N-acetylglucosamine-specific IIC component